MTHCNSTIRARPVGSRARPVGSGLELSLAIGLAYRPERVRNPRVRPWFQNMTSLKANSHAPFREVTLFSGAAPARTRARHEPKEQPLVLQQLFGCGPR